MNKKPTLANLYRQATRAADSAVPEADTLLALARGERPADAERIVAEVAQSALQSDLLHFTRALEPASSALSEEIGAMFGEGHGRAAHTRTRIPPARVAAGRWRNVRRVGAASLAAAMLLTSMAATSVAAHDPGRLKAWWVYRMLFGPDPLAEQRHQYRIHCLGEQVGEHAADGFLAAAHKIIASHR